METEHVQPVESVDARRRSRLPLPLAVVLPVALLVGAAGLGILGRIGVDADVSPPAERGPRAGTVSEDRTPAPDPSEAPAVFPAAIDRMRVQSVADAVAMADEEHGEVIAVAGWLTVPPGQANCGATLDPGATAAVWSLLCWRQTMLLDDPEPFLAFADGRLTALRTPGPHLRPLAMPGAPLGRGVILRNFADGGSLEPRPVVLLGRYLDVRCAAGKETCERTFAIERIVWINGLWQDRTARRAPGLDLPVLSAAEREVVLREAVPGRPLVLREVFLEQADLIRLDPEAAAEVDAVDDRPVWYLRALADASAGPRDVAWLVVDDATGAIIASGDS